MSCSGRRRATIRTQNGAEGNCCTQWLCVSVNLLTDWLSTLPLTTLCPAAERSGQELHILTLPLTQSRLLCPLQSVVETERRMAERNATRILKLQNSVPKVDTQYVVPLVSEKPVSFTVNM